MDSSLSTLSLKPCVHVLAVLPESLEIEVYRLLALSELALLRRVSRRWHERITWFAKAHYNGNVTIHTVSAHDDEDDPLTKPSYLELIGSMMNVKRCTVGFPSHLGLPGDWLPLFKRYLHQSTVEKLEVTGGSKMFDQLSHLDFPKLSSVNVSGPSEEWTQATHLCTFLAAHPRITDLHLRDRSEYGSVILFTGPGVYTFLKEEGRGGRVCCVVVMMANGKVCVCVSVFVDLPLLKSLVLTLSRPIAVETMIANYGKTLTDLRLNYSLKDTEWRTEEEIKDGGLPQFLVPLLKQCCDGLTNLTSLDLTCECEFDASLTLWKAPTSLTSLTLRNGFEGMLPRIQSDTLRRLSLSRVAVESLSTLCLDCPNLLYLSIQSLSLRRHEAKHNRLTETNIIHAHHHPVQTSNGMRPQKLQVWPALPLHTLVCRQDGRARACVPALLRENGSSFSMLRDLDVDYVVPSLSSSGSLHSLTRYFLNVTRGCPGLESLALTVYGRDHVKDNVVERGDRSRSSGSRSNHGSLCELTTTESCPVILTRLATLKLVGCFKSDRERHCQRAFFLDLDEPSLYDYTFPVRFHARRRDDWMDDESRRLYVCVW